MPYDLSPNIDEKGKRLMNQMIQIASIRNEYLRKDLDEEKDIEKINKSFIEYLEEASVDTWDLLLSRYEKYTNFDAIALINKHSEKLGWLKDGELYYQPVKRDIFEETKKEFFRDFNGYFNNDFIEKTKMLMPKAKDDLVLYIMMQNLRENFINGVKKDVFGNSLGEGLVSKIDSDFIENGEWTPRARLFQDDHFRKITLYLTYLTAKEKGEDRLDNWIPKITAREHDSILIRPEHKKIVQVMKDDKLREVDNIYENENFFRDLKKKIKNETPQFYLKIKKYDTLKEFLEDDLPYENYVRVRFLADHLKNVKFDPFWNNDKTIRESKIAQDVLEELIENNKFEVAGKVLINRLVDLRKTEIPPYLMKKVIESKNKTLIAASILTILSDDNIDNKHGKDVIKDNMYMHQIEQIYEKGFLSRFSKNKENLMKKSNEILDKVSKSLGEENTKEMNKAIKDLFAGNEVKFSGIKKKDENFVISEIGDLEETLSIPEEKSIWEED
jgi:hypothetical protein